MAWDPASDPSRREHTYSISDAHANNLYKSFTKQHIFAYSRLEGVKLGGSRQDLVEIIARSFVGSRLGPQRRSIDCRRDVILVAGAILCIHDIPTCVRRLKKCQSREVVRRREPVSLTLTQPTSLYTLTHMGNYHIQSPPVYQVAPSSHLFFASWPFAHASLPTSRISLRGAGRPVMSSKASTAISATTSSPSTTPHVGEMPVVLTE